MRLGLRALGRLADSVACSCDLDRIKVALREEVLCILLKNLDFTVSDSSSSPQIRADRARNMGAVALEPQITRDRFRHSASHIALQCGETSSFSSFSSRQEKLV